MKRILAFMLSLVSVFGIGSYNIKKEMINPELRTIGSLVRTVFPSFNEKKFVFCNSALDAIGKLLFKTKNAECREIYIPRLRFVLLHFGGKAVKRVPFGGLFKRGQNLF